MANAKPEGAFLADGRLAGVFSDGLPTAEQLRAMGMTVDSEYDPDKLRSREVDGDDSHGDEPDVAGPGWVISWDDGKG